MGMSNKTKNVIHKEKQRGCPLLGANRYTHIYISYICFFINTLGKIKTFKLKTFKYNSASYNALTHHQNSPNHWT